MRGNEYISAIDCTQGFYQLVLDPQDKHKIALSTPFGNFQFKKCPFGAGHPCAEFQAAMNSIVHANLYQKSVVYVDGILVF